MTCINYLAGLNANCGTRTATAMCTAGNAQIVGSGSGAGEVSTNWYVEFSFLVQKIRIDGTNSLRHPVTTLPALLDASWIAAGDPTTPFREACRLTNKAPCGFTSQLL